MHGDRLFKVGWDGDRNPPNQTGPLTRKEPDLRAVAYEIRLTAYSGNLASYRGLSTGLRSGH